MRIGKILSELVFPSTIKCLACDNEVFTSVGDCLCANCSLEPNTRFCLNCGRAVPDMADFCDYCKEQTSDYTRARAPYVYNDTAKHIVHRLKYGNARYLAQVIGEYLVRHFSTLGWEIDEVTFVPMHRKRLRQRGYNQAELIAQFFAQKTELPLVEYLLRTKFTENLARMSRSERQKAIAGSISLAPDVKKCQPTILLIDDVFTTSTTSSECARLLKKNKAAAVYILTFATASIKPFLY